MKYPGWELCAFLATELGLPRRGIALVRGGTARHELVRITGLALPAVRARLDAGGDSRLPGPATG